MRVSRPYHFPVFASAHRILITVEAQAALVFIGVMAVEALIGKDGMNASCIEAARIDTNIFAANADSEKTAHRCEHTLRQKSRPMRQFPTLMARPTHQANRRKQDHHGHTPIPAQAAAAEQACNGKRCAAPHVVSDKLALVAPAPGKEPSKPCSRDYPYGCEG